MVLHLLDCVALVGLHLWICWKVAFVGLLMLAVVGSCGRLLVVVGSCWLKLVGKGGCW